MDYGRSISGSEPRQRKLLQIGSPLSPLSPQAVEAPTVPADGIPGLLMALSTMDIVIQCITLVASQWHPLGNDDLRSITSGAALTSQRFEAYLSLLTQHSAVTFSGTLSSLGHRDASPWIQ